jgi:hypothetical protein
MSKIRVGMIGFLLGSVCASAQHLKGGNRVHWETSFDVFVHLPTSEAMKLFTPEGERAWAGEGWDPQYVHAAGRTRDAVGAVFTIQHGPTQAVWTVTRRDEVARKYEYAYFVPDVMVTSIRVSFEPLSTNRTSVHVAYERTALSPGAQAHVAAMATADKKAGAEWQSAIEKYLAAKTTLAQ